MIGAKDSESVTNPVYLCMTDFFAKHLTTVCGATPDDRILLGVSGGRDSMAMLYLFHALPGQNIGVAHCHFGLRGVESDADEAFVREQAALLGLPFYSRRFDCKAWAAQRRLSVQEAARELRYRWWEELRKEAGYDLIATAHHRDDAVETFLMHAARGTGLRGLQGIPARNGVVIRPLLFADSEAIAAYIHRRQIPFREDVSNAGTDYTRNKMRHQLLPLLEEIEPGSRQALGTTLDNMREAWRLYDFALQQWIPRICSAEGEGLRMARRELAVCPAPKTVLLEILRPGGFHRDQIAAMLREGVATGSRFFGRSGCLLVDRDYLIWQPGADGADDISGIRLEKGTPTLSLPGLELVITYTDEVITFDDGRHPVQLSADRLVFPLIIRRWQPGDRFQPAGMGGHHKKLQDLFSDLKISRFGKSQVWVMTSSGLICWVVGFRADERFIWREPT